MSNLPLEITETIIGTLANSDDHSLSSIKACALVCHEFNYLCRSHIFASISLYDSNPRTHAERAIPTTLMLQRLLDTSPEIAHHIRDLNYHITSHDGYQEGSLSETFTKITRLKSLCISSAYLQWNDHPLRPVFLHLLHLPTLIHLELFSLRNFVISDLALCVNLEHFEFHNLVNVNGAPTLSLPEKPIRIRSISLGHDSAEATTKMCAMHCADGTPLIDISCLDKLSIKIWKLADVQASLNLFGRCKQLISIDVDLQGWDSIVDFTYIGLSKMMLPSMQTLKHLYVTTCFDDDNGSNDPLAGLCAELEEMKNKNSIETITIAVNIQTDSDCRRGDEWGLLDAALALPGWPMLQRVSLAIVIWSFSRFDDELERALEKLPQTQFPKLSSSRSLSFEFSVRGELV